MKKTLLRAATRLLLALTPFILHAKQKPDPLKLAAQLTTGDRDAKREASHQLEKLGPAAKDALPALITALEETDSQIWANSIAAIAAIGPDAKDAVPKLLEMLDGSRARSFRFYDRSQPILRAAHALTRIGDAAKPALIEALKTGTPNLRTGAAKALGGFGPKAKDAIPALIENFATTDPALRAELVDALSLIGPDSVAPLRESLASPDPKFREGSARALGALGELAAPAGPDLLRRLTQETDQAARIGILSTLPRLGLPQEQILPPLLTALRDSNDDLRRAATNALLAIHPARKTAVPALIALLHEPAMAERAAHVLGGYSGEAAEAAPVILSLITDEGKPSPAFIEAIAQMGDSAIPALLARAEKFPPAALTKDHWIVQTIQGIGSAGLGELQKALTSPAASTRVIALHGLKEMGADARGARDEIAKLLSDPEPPIRASALVAFVALDSNIKSSLEKIETASRDADPAVRVAAADAAAALGAQARPLAAQLSLLLDDKDPAVRAATLKAVAATGGSNAEILAKLHARLADPGQRLSAIETLGSLGAAATTAPKLAELYPTSDKPTRLAILASLSNAPSEPTLNTARTAIADTDPALRAAGLRTFAKAQTNLDLLLPILATGLQDTDSAVRFATLEIIASLGEKNAEKFVPLLPVIVAQFEHESERAKTLEALRPMRVKDLPAITLALASQTPEARIWACERAARLGPAARPLREKIEPFLNDQNDLLRRTAYRALDQIGK